MIEILLSFLINIVPLSILNIVFAMIIGWESPYKSYINFHN